MTHPPPNGSTSRSLLDRARDHDPAAWERLVRLYSPLVAYWCRRWSVPPQDVSDLLQEVFRSVATHIAAFRLDRAGDSFRAWLRAITRNKVNDHFRRVGREPVAFGGSEARHLCEGVEADDADDADDREAAEARVVREAAELVRVEFGTRTWQAFWMTAAEGRPCPEVAAELGMTSGAVRVAKSRVLRRIRDEVGDLFG